MNQLVRITSSNIALLDLFLENLGKGKDHFRYFEKRGPAALNNHIVTLLLMDGEMPLAYGHLDKEKDRVWLGTATTETMQGKGLGKVMVEQLIAEAKKASIKAIFLSVDKDNAKAISLYEKFGFIKNEDKESYFIYSLNLS